MLESTKSPKASAADGRFVIFFALFFVAWSLRATLLYAIDESIVSPMGRSLYSAATRMAIWLIPVWAFVAWARGARPLHQLGISVWPTARQWAVSAAIGIGFLVLVATCEIGLAGKRFSWRPLVDEPLMDNLLTLGFTPFAEEVVFRGFALTELAGRYSRAFSAAICSALFVAIHLPFWVTHEPLSTALFGKCAALLIFSLVACLVRFQSDSIWPATLMHVGNNLLASVLVAG